MCRTASMVHWHECLSTHAHARGSVEPIPNRWVQHVCPAVRRRGGCGGRDPHRRIPELVGLFSAPALRQPHTQKRARVRRLAWNGAQTQSVNLRETGGGIGAFAAVDLAVNDTMLQVPAELALNEAQGLARSPAIAEVIKAMYALPASGAFFPLRAGNHCVRAHRVSVACSPEAS